MVLQVMIDGQDGHDGDRLVGHRCQQDDPVHGDRRQQEQVLGYVKRLARQPSLQLTAQPDHRKDNCSHQQQSRQAADPTS
jgi:hypothetical protein